MESLPFSFQIIRSSRKTVAIQILPDGSVVIRCPRGMKPEAIRRFAVEKTPWVMGHLQQLQAQPAEPPFSPQELQQLTDLARQDLPARAARWAEIVGVSYGRITIRHQHSLWGSCSAKGNLNFNCLLMLAPEKIRDYVVVHELCHRKQMNHSAAFWAEVGAVLPDYAARRQWLRSDGHALIRRLP